MRQIAVLIDLGTDVQAQEAIQCFGSFIDGFQHRLRLFIGNRHFHNRTQNLLIQQFLFKFTRLGVAHHGSDGVASLKFHSLSGNSHGDFLRVIQPRSVAGASQLHRDTHGAIWEPSSYLIGLHLLCAAARNT